MNNQEGSVTILVLLMVSLLTLLGFASFNNVDTEILIVNNEIDSITGLYHAESIAAKAMNEISNGNPNASWIYPINTISDPTAYTTWNTLNKFQYDTEGFFIAERMGGNNKFKIFVKSEKGNRNTFIEIGYRK